MAAWVPLPVALIFVAIGGTGTFLIIRHMLHARERYRGRADADRRQLAARAVLEVPRQRVDDGAAAVAPRGVDDDVVGLVDDDEVVVLVENVEGEVLGWNLAARRRGQASARW